MTENSGFVNNFLGYDGEEDFEDDLDAAAAAWGAADAARAAEPDYSISKGAKVTVPFGVYRRTDGSDLTSATIIEHTRCRWEITESKARVFNTLLNGMSPKGKEFLKYVFPTLFPDLANVDNISEDSTYRNRDELIEDLRMFEQHDVTIRHNTLKLLILKDIMPLELKNLFKAAVDVIKESQVIKVRFDDDPSKEAYYVAHDCQSKNVTYVANQVSTLYPGVAEREMDGLIPVYVNKSVSNEMRSTLPGMYTLPQITEINSWLSHGILSLYLMNKDSVKSLCLNPLIGNEEFWKRTQNILDNQFTILHNLSIPAPEDMTVYRGSKHFRNEKVRIRSIFSTSKILFVANLFGGEGQGKIIQIPRGTRILDLSYINRKEEEVLVFPSAAGRNMIIEPINVRNRGNTGIRNTYAIRNVRNGNARRMSSRRRRTRRLRH